MSEPAIVKHGHNFVSDYPVEEFRSSLTRAFKDGRADFIALDSNPQGQKFLVACAAWAIDEGLLYNDHSEGDTQQVVASFRLTEQGRREILGQP